MRGFLVSLCDCRSLDRNVGQLTFGSASNDGAAYTTLCSRHSERFLEKSVNCLPNVMDLNRIGGM